MSYPRQLVKQLFRVFGLDIRLVSNIPPSPWQKSNYAFVDLLNRFNIDLIFDVGANAGQFASQVRRCGYAGRIVSFEPLSEAHAELLKTCAGDSLWEAYDRCAIGDKVDTVQIYIAGNSESSSILPMLDTHVDAAPQSAYQGEEMVSITTLDAIAKPYLKYSKAPFLKIDTQGFEWHVIDGAREIMPHIEGILVELSLVHLYDGQHLWREVIDRLESMGFTLWAFRPVFSHPESGRTLQVDGIFFRSD
jgi:FkbM family methyltransferase